MKRLATGGPDGVRGTRTAGLAPALALVLCAVGAGAAAAPPDTELDLADSNLPPVGTRSLLDQMIARDSGLPYPFEALLARLRQKAPGGEILTLLIPDGRSLVRAKGSYELPRVLATVDGATDRPGVAALRGRLFIGYVEQAAQLEVISYNEAAGRYEYQIVENYRAGTQPEVYYASRPLCMTCHQNGATIFSVRPWSETNVNPAVAQRIAEARSTNINADYHGVPLLRPLSIAERFDALTRYGNRLVTSQQIWGQGCGGGEDGVACRRQMLHLALSFLWAPSRFTQDSPGQRRLLSLQRAVWPQYGIPLANPGLANRDPIQDIPGPWDRLTAWLGSRFNDRGGGLNAVAPLPDELNPLTVRPPLKVLDARDSSGVFGIAQLFNATDVALLRRASGNDFGILTSAIDGGALDRLLRSGPLRRREVVRALLQAMDARPLPDVCCAMPLDMPPPRLLGVTDLALTEQSPLVPFRRYCFGCHRGSPLERLDFMNGPDEPSVRERLRRLDSAVASSLQWELGREPPPGMMPPPGSLQWRRMRAAAESGANPVAQLRAALARIAADERGASDRMPVFVGLLLLSVTFSGFLLVQTYAGVRRLGMQRELRRRNDALWEQQLTRAATAYAQHCEPITRQGYRHFEIRDKIDDAAGVCSVLLAPHDGHPLPEFLPGQYLTLRLQIPGQSKPTVRCYSLSDRHHPDHYRITVKRQEPLGVASAYIHDQLRIGDIVEVRAPTGSFHLDPRADTPVVLVAAGIGITPILSMLLAIASENPQRDVWLFFGVRDGSRHIQRRTLERLQRDLPRLHLRVSYSRPREQDRLDRDYHDEGRITPERLRRELPGRDFDFYLCGPTDMVRSLRSDLANWGVGVHRVHVETFSALPTDEEPDLQSPQQMLVHFARSGTTLTWDGKDASLLDLAARHGIEIESGCRAGNCGTCAVAVRSGTVRYTSERDATTEEGACLTCIAVPDGNLELDA